MTKPIGRSSGFVATNLRRLALAGVVLSFSSWSGATESGARTPERFRDCADCPEMVAIPAGSFDMGARASETGWEADEWPSHRVTLKGFALAVTELTFAQWDACVADGGCNGYRPDDMGWGRGERPVVNVGWLDAQAYVQWLSRKTGWRYRLPSEAEWEYACRAGARRRYCGGDDIDVLAWHDGNSGGLFSPARTQPVARKRANGFGLRDMTGNVWEWVEDCYRDSFIGAPNNGRAWASAECKYRVLRGAAWSSLSDDARATARGWDAANVRDGGAGFRIARSF